MRLTRVDSRTGADVLERAVVNGLGEERVTEYISIHLISSTLG